MIFKIRVPENPAIYNTEPGYADVIRERGLPDDLDRLAQAVFLLKKLYWLNNWVLQLGDDHYEFQIRNFDYFWEEIPDMLQAVALEADCSFVLSLTEDLQFDLYVECGDDSQTVAVRFVRLGYEPIAADRLYKVSKTVFISEWQKYAEAVIQLLYKNNLIEENAPEVVEYLQQIRV